MITRVKLTEKMTKDDITNIINAYPKKEIIFCTGGNMAWTEYAVTPTDLKIRETYYGNGGTQEKGVCDEIPVERIAFVKIMFNEGDIAVFINP